MKIAYLSALFALTCTMASAQPMAPPQPDAPPPDVIFGPANARPVLPERGPRLAPEDDAPAAPMGEDPAEDAAPPKDCYRVSLDDGSLILGQIDPKTKVTLRSKVGELAIDLTDIARIDPAFPDDTKFTVTLSNSDRLTGTLQFKELKFQTALGEMPLHAKGLYSLEAGKLHEQTRPVSRRSPDGRTVVTVARKYVRFQAAIEDPNAPPVAAPNYGPYAPAPNPTTYNVPRNWGAPAVTAPPVIRVRPGTPVAPRLVPVPAS